MHLNCPNCRNPLDKVQLSKVEVDHCNNCGGTLFDYNEVNRITLADAEKLSLMKQTDVISGVEKFSPRDGSPLKRIESESVPQYVTLLKSDTTHEVFAYPDDLVNFKKAQDAKIGFYKAWNIPLPALKSVLVFSFVIAVSLGAVLVSSQLTQQSSQSIQASQLCTNGIEVYPPLEGSEGPYAVSCQTATTMTCSAEVRCLGADETYILSNTPTRTHTGFIPSTCSTIRIICNDNGAILETDSQPLE